MLGALAFAQTVEGKVVTRDGAPVDGGSVVIAGDTTTPGVRATMYGQPMIRREYGWGPFEWTAEELTNVDWRLA